MALVPAVVCGQAISVEYDLNTPAYTEPAYPGDPGFEVERGFSMRVGLLTKNYANSEAKRRWSVFVGNQSLDTTPRTDDPYVTEHSAISIEVGHDWLAFERPRVCLSFGASAGLVIISHKNRYSGQCDTAFCNLPDGGWQVSGYGRCEFPVSSKFGLMVGVRGWLLSRDREEMFPFANGPVVSVGIQLS